MPGCALPAIVLYTTVPGLLGAHCQQQTQTSFTAYVLELLDPLVVGGDGCLASRHNDQIQRLQKNRKWTGLSKSDVCVAA